jgi:hypothetical protein
MLVFLGFQEIKKTSERRCIALTSVVTTHKEVSAPIRLIIGMEFHMILIYERGSGKADSEWIRFSGYEFSLVRFIDADEGESRIIWDVATTKKDKKWYQSEPQKEENWKIKEILIRRDFQIHK